MEPTSPDPPAAGDVARPDDGPSPVDRWPDEGLSLIQPDGEVEERSGARDVPRTPWPVYVLVAVYGPIGFLASLGAAVVLVQDLLNRATTFDLLREVFVVGTIVIVGAALAVFVGIYALRGERIYLMVPFCVFLCLLPLAAGGLSDRGADQRLVLSVAVIVLAVLPLLAFLPVNRRWIAAKARQRSTARSAGSPTTG